jgi:hypothetical protein
MFTYFDKPIAPGDNLSFFDKKDVAHLKRLSRCAADIALPFNTQLLCSPVFPEKGASAGLNAIIIPVNQNQAPPSLLVKQSQIISAAIMAVLPMRLFKGSTASGRGTYDFMARDVTQSAHDYIEAFATAQEAFGPDSSLFNHCLPPK